MVRYSGFGQASAPAAATPGGLEARAVLAQLNGYLDDMRRHLERPAAEELAAAVSAAKLAVMERDWKPEWGEREAFVQWVNAGAAGDPPVERAAGAVVAFQSKAR